MLELARAGVDTQGPALRTRSVETRRPVDLALTLGPLVFAGRRDPCMRLGNGEVWRATRTARGPATLHLRSLSPCVVAARAWGPGAEAALDAVSELIGAADDPPPLARGSRVVTEASRRCAGLRIGRSAAVMESLIPVVLAQRVIGVEARAAWVGLVRALGERAPGPVPLLLPPSPASLASFPWSGWHRLGVEHARAQTVRLAAGNAARLEECTTLGLPAARQRLGTLPGIGPWTVNEVTARALGDPDAVSVGDYWLAHQITFALTGEARGSDERMLELLEPWRGQRGRVCRLLLTTMPGLPRFGPRLALRRIAAG